MMWMVFDGDRQLGLIDADDHEDATEAAHRRFGCKTVAVKVRYRNEPEPVAEGPADS